MSDSYMTLADRSTCMFQNRSSNTAATSFLVLGRQCLTDLRDSIRCVHDLTVAGDLSQNPDTEAQCYAKVSACLLVSMATDSSYKVIVGKMVSLCFLGCF